MIAQLNREYILTKPSKAVSRLLSYALFEGRPVTTSGQWVNPLVFALLKVCKNLPQAGKIKKPVFITGTGRSGSTILGIVMSMHKDIAYLNEPKAIWHSVLPDEDLIGSYSTGSASFRFGSEKASAKLSLHIHRIYSWYLALTFSNRILDKYPEMIFRSSFLKKIFPDVKILFLYRNGWDTILSASSWSAQHGTSVNGVTHDWWGVDRRKWNLMLTQLVKDDDELSAHYKKIEALTSQAELAAVEWILTMKEGLTLYEKHPEFILPVKYEDLVSNTVNVLQSICSFCELKTDSKMFGYAEQVLKSVAPKPRIQLPEFIELPFLKYMNLLGYP